MKLRTRNLADKINKMKKRGLTKELSGVLPEPLAATRPVAATAGWPLPLRPRVERAAPVGRPLRLWKREERAVTAGWPLRPRLREEQARAQSMTQPWPAAA